MAAKPEGTCEGRCGHLDSPTGCACVNNGPDLGKHTKSCHCCFCKSGWGLKWTPRSPVNLLISGPGRKQEKHVCVFQVLELARWMPLHWVPLRDVFIISGSWVQQVGLIIMP